MEQEETAENDGGNGNSRERQGETAKKNAASRELAVTDEWCAVVDSGGELPEQTENHTQREQEQTAGGNEHNPQDGADADNKPTDSQQDKGGSDAGREKATPEGDGISQEAKRRRKEAKPGPSGLAEEENKRNE